MKTIAFFHNKGGVGKTTACVNIAGALAQQHQRVLLIDLDSQANATCATGLVEVLDLEEKVEDPSVYKRKTIYGVLASGKVAIEDVALRSNCGRHKFDVLPSHIYLSTVEQTLSGSDQNTLRLARKLAVSEDRWDFVLIDVPPSLNVFARIALLTADHLVIPSDLKHFSTVGIRNVLRFLVDVDLQREKDLGKGPIHVVGVLPTKVSTLPQLRMRIAHRARAVKDRYGIEVLGTWLYERDALAKCLENTIVLPDGVELPAPETIFDYRGPSATEARKEIQAATEAIVASVEAE